MANESDRDRERDAAQALARLSGLNLSSDEMKRVVLLYERFSGDRAALVGASAGELEPVTIFHASRRGDRP